ncbi:MAG: tRNA pseudouridine(38-40) synthase TruA [Planctomycetaceae bacterium]
MRNVCLTLAYDGTNYAGWQVQPNGTSVQEVIEGAIHDLTGEKVRIMVAGRTDAGVHAIGQVANFPTTSTISCEGIRAALQVRLPEDIIVREAVDVPEDFHATRSAKKKRYRYVIHTGRAKYPFLRQYAYHWRGRLDAGAMHEAAQVLVGTHDFRSFESHFPNKSSSVRTIFETSVTRHAGWPTWDRGVDKKQHALEDDAQQRPFLWFDVVADGFLYNMVRAIIGTLIRVGELKWNGADLKQILESQSRAHAGTTAPAHGLYLVEVDYGDEFGIGAGGPTA